jgi:predicted GNAT family acetyltransferase
MDDAGTAGVTVVNSPERLRYELRLGDTVIGFVTYRLVGRRRVVFIHTEVDAAHSGTGLAARLAKFALDDVRAAGKRIVPVCPFIAEYLRTHPEYDDIVDKPTGQGVATGARG